MRRENEKGVALVMVMILLVVLSVMATSLMFLSQTETWSSLNYRLMTQARYGAETGVNTAVNYLLNSYTPPASPFTGYTINATGVTFPATTGDLVGVTYNNGAVVLSSNPGITANYPVSSVKTAFSSATSGSLAAGNATVNYTASAVLLSMRQVTTYGTTIPVTIQTWRVTGDATVSGVQSAQIEVSTIFERQAFPQNSYAMFAASGGCGAITFSGNASIQSYDSTHITYDASGNVILQPSGGNIGTNGNFTESGTTTVYGSLSSPRTGVGKCNSGNPDAWTSSGKATVTAGTVQLPQPIVYPTPDAPNPMPPTTSLSITQSSTCTGLGITGCTSSLLPGAVGIALVPGTQVAPTTYGNIKMSGQATLHFTAGYYNINSIALSGGSTIVVDSGPVILNVAGVGVTTPVDMSGGTLTNSPPIATNFQILYAGSGNVTITGGSAAAGLIYTPNASFKSSGGTTWFGEVISNTVTDTGGTTFVYDRSLATSFATVTNPTLSAFTWKKY